MSKRVMMTGGTGFVGANLVRRFLADGHDVHLLVRPGYNPWRIDEVRGDVKLHVSRLDEAAAVGRVVSTAKPDWVFHLAAHGAYSWQAGAAEIVRTNYMGTITLVEACRKQGVEAIVNTGSSSEYGFQDHAPAEDELPDPNSHYAATKVAATTYCRFTARKFGLRIPTLRLYSAYGPYEEPARLLPTLIVHGLRGQLPPLASADIARDYIAVEDICDAYHLAATAPMTDPGAIYNVGTGAQTDLRRVVEIARDVLPIVEEPAWGSMADRHWDTTVWVADSRKLQRDLGWRPRVDFVEGFQRMADWFRSRSDLRAYYDGRLAA
jgi:dolichol-phosphate mannosyltransferase